MLLLQGIILAIPKVYIMLLLEKVTHILVSLLKVMKSNLFVSQIIITSPRTQECGHASACSSEHVIQRVASIRSERDMIVEQIGRRYRRRNRLEPLNTRLYSHSRRIEIKYIPDFQVISQSKAETRLELLYTCIAKRKVERRNGGESCGSVCYRMFRLFNKPAIIRESILYLLIHVRQIKKHTSSTVSLMLFAPTCTITFNLFVVKSLMKNLF